MLTEYVMPELIGHPDIDALDPGRVPHRPVPRFAGLRWEKTPAPKKKPPQSPLSGGGKTDANTRKIVGVASSPP